MKNRLLLGVLIGVGLVALGFGLNWVNNGLNLRASVLERYNRSCLEASGAFNVSSIIDILRSDPDRWDHEFECSIYSDYLHENTPYLVFIRSEGGNWDSPEVKGVWITAYDAFFVRAKAARADIENGN